MISFVWRDDDTPFVPWYAGCEMYVHGLIKGLVARGYPARLITSNPTATQSAQLHASDIPLHAISSQEALADMDDTLVFVYRPPRFHTKRPAYFLLATPAKDPRSIFTPGVEMPRTIVMSEFKARYWQNALELPRPPAVVYPFVDPVFASVERHPYVGPARILFAGRAVPEKGIYGLFHALHLPPLRDTPYRLTCVEGHAGRGDGVIINSLYHANPWVHEVVPLQETRLEMAQLMARHDVVVVPTSSFHWVESWGMVSGEGQHAGCRVVGANDGGIPESDCGGLMLFEHDNPVSLSERLARAAQLGPLTPALRQAASQCYTVKDSVNAFLHALAA